MASITFPFFIVTQRHGELWVPVVNGTGYVAAFSIVGNAKKYMRTFGSQPWEMRMVSRGDLKSLLSAFQNLGARGFCIDPKEGAEQQRIDFDQIGGE